MTDTHRVTYTGSPSGARVLVQLLEAEGVDVRWTPPMETRSIGSAAEAVVVGLVTMGSWEAIRAGVAAFRKHQPRSKIEIDGEEQDD